jgi:EAL domain-containing protein (putative c-di-GMP-specific phosphodiesterase class I)
VIAVLELTTQILQMRRKFLSESDLIVEIGEWVLREACSEAASWDDSVQIAVNVSAIQFSRGNLQQSVATVLRETGIAPERLELEITEGVLIENVARATLILKGLKKLGVRIALDDFGTGYSLSPRWALRSDRSQSCAPSSIASLSMV